MRKEGQHKSHIIGKKCKRPGLWYAIHLLSSRLLQ
jgi:hypothetical protein